MGGYVSAALNKRTNEVMVWSSENHVTTLTRHPGIFEFYIQDDEGEYTSVFGEKLKKCSFNSWDELQEARNYLTNVKRVKMYESDIAPEFKVISKLFYKTPAPKLNITLWDIEVDYDPLRGFSDPMNPYAPINAISLFHYWSNESYVLAVPPPNFDINTFDNSLRELATVELFKNEKDLLRRFLKLIEKTDLLSGWHTSGFDDPYTCKRIEMVLGRDALQKMCFPGAPPPRFNPREFMGRQQLQVVLHGRVCVDYLDIFKKYEVKERQSYKLEVIAEEFLPHLPKLSYTGTLHELYNKDFNHFVRYNIRDTEILRGFEDKLGYIALANEMRHSVSGQFDHIRGTVRLVDYAIVNYCHYVLDVIVPDRWDTQDGSIMGAYVLLPQKGMHEYIGSIDINSLYPSDIMAINISPETYIGQFIYNIKDWESLYAKEERELTLKLENGDLISKLTSEWREYLWDNKWAVSGYGTVYSQENPGIIPTILGDWYKERKEFQKLKNKYYEEAKAILRKYAK